MIPPEIPQLVLKQAEELLDRATSSKAGYEMSIFMADTSSRFANFKSSDRKLLIKFLIETDEVVDKIDPDDDTQTAS